MALLTPHVGVSCLKGPLSARFDPYARRSANDRNLRHADLRDKMENFRFGSIAPFRQAGPQGLLFAHSFRREKRRGMAASGRTERSQPASGTVAPGLKAAVALSTGC
jgi:hypothetical protein